ncbi:MAG: NUDIX domain-containing protein [Pseudomonadota bacterium]
MADAPDPQPIHDAATLILLRQGADGPSVLMGQRGAGAVFMPSKFVFPGGRVDPADADVALTPGLDPAMVRQLARHAPDGIGPTLAATAIRELWEETGLRLARPGTPPPAPPKGWAGFYETGHVPAAETLRFIFRAITPPGRPRRFDARFFLADAAQIAGDADDFSQADQELSHLAWVSLAEARTLDLPFVTRVVMATLAEHVADPDARHDVPFFRHGVSRSEFLTL